MSRAGEALVSVIVPTYNCAAFVAEALDSALAQDHPAVEVVVVNDGSTDDTMAVLARYGDRIRVIDQKNAGPPAARNAGLVAARGEFIAFLDADDVWWPDKLSAQLALLRARPEVGTVITGWQVWSPAADGRFHHPEPLRARPADAWQDLAWCDWMYNRLLFDCELLTTTVMMRRTVVEAIGAFDPTLWNGDDYDYWLRASRVAQIAKLRMNGALYRVVPASVSRSPKPRNFEYEVIDRALKRWGRTGPDGRETPEPEMRRRLDQLVHAHAWTHLKRGDPAIALSSFVGLLRRDPMRLRIWSQMILALGSVIIERGPSFHSRR